MVAPNPTLVDTMLACAAILRGPGNQYAKAYAAALPHALADHIDRPLEAEHAQIQYILVNLRATTPALKDARQTLRERERVLARALGLSR